MERPRLALLNASYGEYTGPNFRRELDADLVEFEANEGDLPGTFDFDGFVVTGSRASVYWEDSWIADLIDWTREAIDRGLPCLGVCYGHQVVAEALGGTVEHMGEYEIGYREVERVGDSRLLAGVDDSFTVFTTHQDAVTELPPGAEPIAENEYGNHGFRTDGVFTVQFHPEYDLETAEAVAGDKDLPAEKEERVMDGITEENYAAACEAKRLFANFTEYVREEHLAAAAD
ncbi:MAG: type 1 glutamine amidotransferase [Halobacteriales archaeon]